MSDRSREKMTAALEKAEAGSRELDALIWAHLEGVKYVSHCEPYSFAGRVPTETQVEFRVPPKRKTQFTGSYGIKHAPPVTTSLDAATALVKEDLPGWLWGVTQGNANATDAVEFQGNVWPSQQPFLASDETYGYHASPAIALCIAVLRALGRATLTQEPKP